MSRPALPAAPPTAPPAAPPGAPPGAPPAAPPGRRRAAGAARSARGTRPPVTGRAPSRPTSGLPRREEAALLAIVWLALVWGFVMVLGSAWAAGQALTWSTLVPLGILALCLLALHATLVLAASQADPLAVVCTAFLSGFGLLIQVRLSGAEGTGGALGLWLLPIATALLLSLALAAAQGRYRWLEAGRWWWAALSLLVLAALLLLGQRYRGGIYAAGLFTPGELLKLTVPLFLAAYLSREAKAFAAGYGPLPLPAPRPLLPLLAFWAVLSALLLWQRDLGLLIILSGTLLALLIVASGRLGYLLYAALGATGLGLLVLTVFSHGQRRIAAWQAPFQDPTGSGWQILQGLSGLHAGGLWGEGFGQGNPEYTPIAQSDFVYAVVGEELGFVGALLVLAIFLVLFARLIAIAERAPDLFGRLLATGLLTPLALQTLLHIGGVTKSIPLTGLTLPFISHGGSSLLAVCAAIGLLLAISDRAPPRSRARPAASGPRRTRRSPAIPTASTADRDPPSARDG